jgi:Flp pilus assembly protein TadD
LPRQHEIRHWKQAYPDEINLREATATLSPGKARAFNNLGFAYEQAGGNEAARSAYLRALKIDPKIEGS